jgi:rhodanese-related sulfurtransferase
MTQDTAPQIVNEVDGVTAKRWVDAGEAVFVDVREVIEYQQARIPGASLVPLSAFDPAKIPQVPGQKVVIFCAVGKRSAMACEFLQRQGLGNLYNLQGGIQAWGAAGLPVELGPPPAP